MNPTERLDPGDPVTASGPGSLSEPPRPEPANSMWEQVLTRDDAENFIHGVRTIGIYRRPSSGSRAKRRAKVLLVDAWPPVSTRSGSGLFP